MRGNIDVISQNGVVEGWCWDEAQPDKRVTVSLYSGRKECGRCTAAAYRADLKEAGIGDGWHGFTMTIPPEFLLAAGTQQFSLCDLETGLPIGAPQDVRFTSSVLLEDRLNDLENRLELLEQHLRLKAEVPRDTDMERRVFSMVGSFLSALGEGAALTEKSTGPHELKLEKPLTRIRLPRPDRARALIVVEASAPVSLLHQTLEQLKACAGGSETEYLVLANRSYPDAVLINAVASGHRYMRPIDTGTDTLNQTLEETGADHVVFVQAGAQPQRDALEQLLSCIKTSPRIGAVAATPSAADLSALPDLEPSEALEAPLRHALEGMSAMQPAVVRRNELRASMTAFRKSALKECGGVVSSDMDDMGRALRLTSAKLADSGWCVLRHRQAVYTPGHETDAGYWHNQEGDFHRNLSTPERTSQRSDVDAWGAPFVLVSSPSLKRDRDIVDLLWMQGVCAIYLSNDPAQTLAPHLAERGGFFIDVADTSKVFALVREGVVLTNGGTLATAETPPGVLVCGTLEEALIVRSRSLRPVL